MNPNEPDAEIMKMKSGGTDMAHKAEHAVDMSGEGAVIAVTLHGGAKGEHKEPTGYAGKSAVKSARAREQRGML